MNCKFCYYTRGKHADGCPATSEDHIEAVQHWEQGHEDGRGHQPQADKHPAYLLGWRRGDYMAREAKALAAAASDWD